MKASTISYIIFLVILLGIYFYYIQWCKKQKLVFNEKFESNLQALELHIESQDKKINYLMKAVEIKPTVANPKQEVKIKRDRKSITQKTKKK